MLRDGVFSERGAGRGARAAVPQGPRAPSRPSRPATMGGGSPAHPLVAQLRFARREFARDLEGVSEAAPPAAGLTPRPASRGTGRGGGEETWLGPPTFPSRQRNAPPGFERSASDLVGERKQACPKQVVFRVLRRDPRVQPRPARARNPDPVTGRDRVFGETGHVAVGPKRLNEYFGCSKDARHAMTVTVRKRGRHVSPDRYSGSSLLVPADAKGDGHAGPDR